MKKKPGVGEDIVTHKLNRVHHKSLFKSSETNLTTLKDVLGNVENSALDISAERLDKSTTGNTQQIEPSTSFIEGSTPHSGLNLGSQSDLGTRSVKQNGRSCVPSPRSVKTPGRPGISGNRPSKVTGRTTAPGSRPVKLKKDPNGKTVRTNRKYHKHVHLFA